MLLIVASPVLFRIVKRNRVIIQIASGGDENVRELADDAHTNTKRSIISIHAADLILEIIKNLDL